MESLDEERETVSLIEAINGDSEASFALASIRKQLLEQQYDIESISSLQLS